MLSDVISPQLALQEPTATFAMPVRRGQLHRSIAKRQIDIAIALFSLVALLPLMLAVAALSFAMTGSNPFYAHRRVGKNGQPFNCLKFRTMVPHSDEVLAAYLREHPAAASEWAATQKLRHDPRVTPMGRFLRVSSIDELPQLLNVLAGHMSCVGPRPITFRELERYGAGAGHYFEVKPGLTGLWQISGRSDLSYRERVLLDLRYIHEWSITLDLFILCRTIVALLRPTGAA